MATIVTTCVGPCATPSVIVIDASDIPAPNVTVLEPPGDPRPPEDTEE